MFFHVNHSESCILEIFEEKSFVISSPVQFPQFTTKLNVHQRHEICK